MTMRLLILYLLILFFGLPAAGTAQNCPHFDRLMQTADTYWKSGEFEKALNQLAAAREHCPRRGVEVEEKSLAFTREITRKYEEAELDKRRADEAFKRVQKEQLITKATLAKLEKANAATVELLLENAELDILNLRYEAALKKLNAAASLEALKSKVAAAMLEIAFWHGEAGNSAQAVVILDTAAALVGNATTRKLLQNLPSDTVGCQLQLRRAMQALDSSRFTFLFEQKYYAEMIQVKGGTFDMGCDTTIGPDCLRQQVVSSFYIAKHETTVWQFALYCYASGLQIDSFLNPAWNDPGNNPVVNVRWSDAVLYTNWVSRQKGAQEAITQDAAGDYTLQLRGVYRLPTEAEWEYAARGGPHGSTFVYAGSDEPEEFAWFQGNSRLRTHSVGQKKSNALGLHDMSGNVSEWCWDWYQDYPKAPKKDYTGPESRNINRVVRGGSWLIKEEECRVAYRKQGLPDFAYENYGFRMVFAP
jgi:sulfatase modifying factor 1